MHLNPSESTVLHAIQNASLQQQLRCRQSYAKFALRHASFIDMLLHAQRLGQRPAWAP